MALTSAIPASGAVVNTGDTITIATDDAGGFQAVNYIRTGTGGAGEVVYTAAGAYGAGFTGTTSVDVGAGTTTLVFSRNAGWDSSPFSIDILTVSAPYALSYLLLAEGQYPTDMQPFNKPVKGKLAVSEGNVAVRTDVAHMNFDETTFDVADDGQGKVSVTGLDVGGSAIEVINEADPPLTTDVTKFTYTGLGVTAYSSGTDEVTVNVTGAGGGVDVQDDGTGDFPATTINFADNISVTESPPGVAHVSGAAASSFTALTDTPASYAASGFMPRQGAGSSLVWSAPPVFSPYFYQTSTPPIGGAFLATGGGGTYSGFTSFDIYNSDKFGINLKEVWDNLTSGDHLVVRNVGFDIGRPTGYGVYLINTVTPDTGFTTIAVTNVSADGSPVADTYIEVTPVSTGAGAGDITGPPTSTDRAVATWDGAGGDALQDNPVTITASGDLVMPGDLSAGVLLGEEALLADRVTGPTSAAGQGYGILWSRDGTPTTGVYRDNNGDDTTIGSILVEDATTPVVPAAAGYVNTLNFEGSAVSVADGGDGTVDITIAAGAAPVQSWGPVGSPRTGVINPIADDYDADMVVNDPAGSTYATGTDVQSAINQLDSALEDLNARESGLGSFVYDDSSTAGAGIGVGEVRFNNATPSSATEIYVSDENAVGAAVSNALAGLLNYEISFTRLDSAFMSFKVTAVQDDTTFWTLTATTRGGVGSIVDGDGLLLHTIGKPEITYTGDVTNAGSVMSIGTDKVLTAHILDDNVTLGKMASGTAGALIVYDASGNPVDIGAGTASEVLTSNGSAIPTWESASAPGAHDLAGASHTSTGENAGMIAQADGADGVEWVTTAASFGPTGSPRTGVVVATAGDYDADQIDYDNGTSGLTATEVQAAIDELEAEKAPIDVTGLSGRLADSQFVHVEEEGGAQGQAHTINFTGATVTASVSAGEATVDIGGQNVEGADIQSTAISANYVIQSQGDGSSAWAANSSDVASNDSTVDAGAGTVSDALEWLDTNKASTWIMSADPTGSETVSDGDIWIDTATL